MSLPTPQGVSGLNGVGEGERIRETALGSVGTLGVPTAGSVETRVPFREIKPLKAVGLQGVWPAQQRAGLLVIGCQMAVQGGGGAGARDRPGQCRNIVLVEFAKDSQGGSVSGVCVELGQELLM